MFASLFFISATESYLEMRISSIYDKAFLKTSYRVLSLIRAGFFCQNPLLVLEDDKTLANCSKFIDYSGRLEIYLTINLNDAGEETLVNILAIWLTMQGHDKMIGSW